MFLNVSMRSSLVSGIRYSPRFVILLSTGVEHGPRITTDSADTVLNLSRWYYFKTLSGEV